MLYSRWGGLGNQMFQYAAGRRLASAHGTRLKLDLSWFETQEKRRYELGALSVYESFATPGEVFALTRERQVFGPEPLSRSTGYRSADRGRGRRRRSGKHRPDDREGEAALRKVELQQEPLREEPEDEEEEQTERRSGERREPSPVGQAGQSSHHPSFPSRR